MYFLIVVLLMFVFPAVSLLVDLLIFKNSTGIILLVGKWFVFWAVGVRLFSAGLRQAISPQFTAEQIFGIKSKEPLIVVQELGFANVSLGLLGLCAIFRPAWVLPTALAGGLFYGLAALRHIVAQERNQLENFALLSDLFAFIVLLIYFIGAIIH